jgi:tRNA-specific 2-thiouridylase
VSKIDPKRNILVAGPKESLLSRSMVVGDINFVSVPSLEAIEELSVKIRYRQSEVPCQAKTLPGGKVLAVFKDPQSAVTPGQAAVFYRGDMVALGGTILEAAAS